MTTARLYIRHNRSWWKRVVEEPGFDALPERVRLIVARQDRASEHLVACVQMAIGIFLWSLYLLAPRPADAASAMFAPVPLALAAFTGISFLRLMLIRRRTLSGWFVGASIIVDVGLLVGLIWSFHLQYGFPAGLTLKTPAFVYLFLIIVLRALRSDPRFVLAAGSAAALGWAVLTAAVIATTGTAAITHNFSEYLVTDRILIGAEVEKIIVIIVITLLLTASARRAQRTLVASLREQTAFEEVRRFLPKGVANQIASSNIRIEAGHAVERDAAILMLDIRGFTALSKQLPPARIVEILTALHARIIPVVRSNGGVIDKFLGDGLMATFGAANTSASAAADALRAMELSLDAAQAWRQELPSMGVTAPLSVNAAVAAGRVVFTTLGDGDRLEYTVIGDAVNLAAKLEKHNKVAGTRALICDETLVLAIKQGYVPSALLVRFVNATVAGAAAPLTLHGVQ